MFFGLRAERATPLLDGGCEGRAGPGRAGARAAGASRPQAPRKP